jgi:hypothetical protein
MSQFAVALIVSGFAFAATTDTGATTAAEELLVSVNQGVTAVAGIADFVAVSHRTEYKGGQLPEQIVLLKWRRNPRSVYLRWLAGPKTGQEVLWVDGRNDGKLQAHRATFPTLTVSLDPNGWLAMQETRNPIRATGLDYIMSMVANDVARTRATPSARYTVRGLGVRRVYDADSACFEAEVDRRTLPSAYALKTMLCLRTDLHVPNRVQIWDEEDGALRLIGDYGYEQMKLNVGLTDRDFDASNPEYTF